jgi:hypothetical protein
MASPRPWPFDDEDRPSGSVRPLSQADLQAILAHLDDDPDGLLAGTGADQPVVAVRVRASVGRPGGSAEATWRRLRAAESAGPLRGMERPGRVEALRAIDPSACPRSWRTFGPRRLRRQSQPELASTRRGMAPPGHAFHLLWTCK